MDFRGPVMGSLKSPCTTSYRSSIDTVVLNCLLFLRKSRFFAFWWQTERQTDKQTNRWTAPMHLFMIFVQKMKKLRRHPERDEWSTWNIHCTSLLSATWTALITTHTALFSCLLSGVGRFVNLIFYTRFALGNLCDYPYFISHLLSLSFPDLCMCSM